jgi:opacity protein-like surface antigen
MRLKIRFCICIVLYFALSSTSLAAYPDVQSYKDTSYKNPYRDILSSDDSFEVIGAPGIANLQANNLSSIGVTSSETDTLEQTNTNEWSALAAQLGVGFIHIFPTNAFYFDNVQWFPSVEPELNLYYLSSNSIDGTVSRFGNPVYGQLNFDMPVHSTRLMFDIALTFLAYKPLSLYGIGGIGSAWNRIGYNDTGSTCNLGLSLNTNTNVNFAWETGVGVLYAFNNRVGVSLEYLYAGLGNVSTSSNGNLAITSPASFNLQAQTGFLGLHIAL